MEFHIVWLLTLIAVTNSAPTENVENPELIGGHFQGDILIPSGQSLDNFMRSGIIGNQYRWPQNTVIYQLDPNFTSSERTVINNAINEIASKTCIRFTQRTTQTDYVNVVRGAAGTGCNSYVGRIRGRQNLNLQAQGCIYHGIVAHEFIHAIGFYHEHSRTDRDAYVTINWSNIQNGYAFAFDKYPADRVSDQGVSYDYGSVMHYGPTAFAKNYNIPTIIVPSGVVIGQRNGLSSKDATKIRNMYGC